jgi:hypothetical protein
MPVKRKKKASPTIGVRKADVALETLKPIFAKIGWSPVIGCDLNFSTFTTSKDYITLWMKWDDAFIKNDPSPVYANYKHDGVLDRESYRRDSSEWNARRQQWFNDQLNVILAELKSVCLKNGWRFRTAGTQLRINP